MASLDGFKQWRELFDENVSKVYCQETIPNLKILSMMMFSIRKEIQKIEKDLLGEVLVLRNRIGGKGLADCNSNSRPLQALLTNNRLTKIPNKSADYSDTVESHESKNSSSKNLSYDENQSIIISDGDSPSDQIHTSPEIKKKHRRNDFKRKLRRKRKLFDTASATHSSLSHSNDVAKFPDTDETCLNKDPPSICLLSKSPRKDNTPQKFDSGLNDSIVQCTPVSKTENSRKKDNMFTFNIKRRVWKEKKSSLTQSFLRRSGLHDYERSSDRLLSENNDSDQTLVTIDKPIENDSPMGITRMVSFLNRPSLENRRQSDTSSNLELIFEASREQYGEDDTTLNSAMIEENHSSPKEQDPSQGLNALLAEMQNIPDQVNVEQIVVRGNARKKLPGWSCKDCEKFYLKQGLNANEMLALNKCSKHRGYAKPREDTLPGFWTLNVSTPESDNA